MFFLAGPIQGAGDWHVEMAKLLTQAVGESLIVNPSRYDESHPHFQRRLEGPELDERQTDWERYYLRQAATDWHAGCIVFWLAAQVEPRKDGSSYGRDTYGEVGEWRAHLMHETSARVVMGAEENFPGLSQIKRNFEQALGSSFRIYDTMQEVAEKAALYAQPELSFNNRVSA
jgi:hypothetical protein